MAELAKLERPTVGDVIALLSTLPPDAPFRMEDTDTDWTIDTIHVEIGKTGIVWFSGAYHEMSSSREE